MDEGVLHVDLKDGLRAALRQTLKMCLPKGVSQVVNLQNSRVGSHGLLAPCTDVAEGVARRRCWRAAIVTKPRRSHRFCKRL